MKSKTPLLVAFDVMAAKGAVNYQGAKRNYARAREEVDHLFTDEEKVALSIARGHAVDIPANSDREEWDWVCAGIRNRLWPEAT